MHVTAYCVFFILSAAAVSSEDVQLCPDDWFDANTLGCYKFLDSQVNLSWVEAQLACEKAGGYLAEPRTQSQDQFLSEVAVLAGSFTGIGYWYIGLTDLGREGHWLWIHNKESVTDASWGANRPINRTSNSKDCAMMVLKNNQVWWEDHDCLSPDVKHHPVAPVCQQDTTASEEQTTIEQPETTTSEEQTTTEQPETTTVVTCPDNWTEFNQSCYIYINNIVNWYDAEELCQISGGHITSVHSAEEDAFLLSLACGNLFWLGVGGYPLGYSLVWSDGTDFDYSNEISNTSGTGDCLYQDTLGIWSLGTCIYNANYICKL